MKVFRTIGELIRHGLSTNEAWKDIDDGLIVSWERGRAKAAEDPELAKGARAGELVPLPWKGGVDKELKTKHKFGAYRYLAMWQGLRGEDLNIDTERDVVVTCTRFGVPVIFTSDMDKLAPDDSDGDAC